jgi:hypothetical protein
VDKLTDPAARAERVFQLLRLEQESTRAPTWEHLRHLASERPRITALDLYREGMDVATRVAGKRYWVQKATSYVFYAREILSLMPETRLIYLVRNPYDIAASKKRRHKERERIWNTMVGWNKGMRIAVSLADEFPDRFRIIRYEDLTARSEDTVRSLMEWIGEPFDPSYLDVPHVNRSETGYSLTGDGKGLNRSRINYYVENLSHAEIAALDFLANGSFLDKWYPGLPHRRHSISLGSKLVGAMLAASGPLWYGFNYACRLWRQPTLLVARTTRRLR